ncbi:cytochrome c oxidase subunit 4 [Singulisphaera sp. GP187]|uniref:cytochrome C oxidase subunit IV family protein n=1 Tax=Singulisphaera sp. GP187 TaxID=1882752 RepID=UPI00092C8021|nr:cytochrome C oxidase subunit IV family protein [Singulisphaera sp. GP187]SIO21937.1 cytochrome c oxidase subunit 4 [Singulisphaera sp. GP187]
MSNTNLTHEQEMAVESHFSQYIKIFLILIVFTLSEYFYASIFANHAFIVLVLGLMSMAIIKATLVGLYFMHLKFEGKWVYAMLIPASILAMVLTLALFPDVAMQPVTEENPDLEGVETTPVQPGAAVSILRASKPVG